MAAKYGSNVESCLRRPLSNAGCQVHGAPIEYAPVTPAIVVHIATEQERRSLPFEDARIPLERAVDRLRAGADVQTVLEDLVGPLE